MHEQGVAHRDCSMANILMEANSLYPRGFHPIYDVLLPDATNPAWPLSRSQVGVRYYFVDYGISTQAPSGEHPNVVGTFGIDQEVPELSKSIPYDPFKVDIFIIGNVLKKELCGVSVVGCFFFSRQADRVP